MKPDPYSTVRSATRFEIEKVKGSRFIGTLAPFGSEESLKETIAALRGEYPDANHHCWAWRRGEGFRYSDDGEPSGTAGRPLLQQLDGAGLDRVQLVVTRIFGGTKLGAGGLVRAYGAAAKAVIEAAEIVDVIPTRRVKVVLPYSAAGVLESIVRAHRLQPIVSEFGETIVQAFDIPWEQVDGVVADFRERTAAQAEIEIDPDDS